MMIAERTLIAEENGISLWLHPKQRLLHHTLGRYPGAATLERVLERGLEEIVQGRATKWLSDDRKGGALPKSHHEWAATVWGPRAAKAGWKHWALLPPSDMLGSANMNRVVEVYASLGVNVRTFAQTKHAFDWLESV